MGTTSMTPGIQNLGSIQVEASEGWRVDGTEEPVGRPVAGAALMESNTRRQSGRRSLCQRGS